MSSLEEKVSQNERQISILKRDLNSLKPLLLLSGGRPDDLLDVLTAEIKDLMMEELEDKFLSATVFRNPHGVAQSVCEMEE